MHYSNVSCDQGFPENYMEPEYLSSDLQMMHSLSYQYPTQLQRQHPAHLSQHSAQQSQYQVQSPQYPVALPQCPAQTSQNLAQLPCNRIPDQAANAAVIVSVNQRRLPNPCPIPHNCFSDDVIQAIDKNSIKGILKIRLIRQAASFYHGFCPRPTHDEYTSMATTLCKKYGDLRYKKPTNNHIKEFVFYVSQIYRVIASCMINFMIRTCVNYYI